MNKRSRIQIRSEFFFFFEWVQLRFTMNRMKSKRIFRINLKINSLKKLMARPFVTLN